MSDISENENRDRMIQIWTIQIWTLGVLHERSGAGSFATAIARAAAWADEENFEIMRPVMTEMVRKYPKYYQQEIERMRIEAGGLL